MINKSGRCEEELSGRFKYVLKNYGFDANWLVFFEMG